MSTAWKPTDTPVACRLSSPAQAARLNELRATIFAACSAIEETADGYAFAFDGHLAPQIIDFVASERECCPFLTFDLHLPPASEPLYLALSGTDEIKAFVAATFLSLVPTDSA